LLYRSLSVRRELLHDCLPESPILAACEGVVIGYHLGRGRLRDLLLASGSTAS